MQDTVVHFKADRSDFSGSTTDWTMFMVLTTSSANPIAGVEKVIWEMAPDAGGPIQQLRWQQSTHRLAYFSDALLSGSVFLPQFFDKRHVLVMTSRSDNVVGGAGDTLVFIDGIFVMRRVVFVVQHTPWFRPGSLRIAGGTKQSNLCVLCCQRSC